MEPYGTHATPSFAHVSQPPNESYAPLFSILNAGSTRSGPPGRWDTACRGQQSLPNIANRPNVYNEWGCCCSCAIPGGRLFVTHRALCPRLLIPQALPLLRVLHSPLWRDERSRVFAWCVCLFITAVVFACCEVLEGFQNGDISGDECSPLVCARRRLGEYSACFMTRRPQRIFRVFKSFFRQKALIVPVFCKLPKVFCRHASALQVPQHLLHGMRLFKAHPV